MSEITRRVDNLADSGYIFECMDPEAGTITLNGFGERCIWGPCVGKSYAIRFMNQEFEFVKRVCFLTSDEKKARAQCG